MHSTSVSTEWTMFKYWMDWVGCTRMEVKTLVNIGLLCKLCTERHCRRSLKIKTTHSSLLVCVWYWSVSGEIMSFYLFWRKLEKIKSAEGFSFECQPKLALSSFEGWSEFLLSALSAFSFWDVHISQSLELEWLNVSPRHGWRKNTTW